MRPERGDAGPSARPGYPSPRAGNGTSRGRTERERPGRDVDPRTPGGRAPGSRAGQPPRRGSLPEVPGRPPQPRDVHRSGGGSPPSPRSHPPTQSGSRLPGAVAALGVFLVTLAAAAADSYIGIGLGRITLVALTASSAAATLLVRRRDLVTTLIAPPLVFMAVALLNIALAPSATFTLPTMATLLIQGFPAMAIATGVTLVLTLVRLVTRR